MPNLWSRYLYCHKIIIIKIWRKGVREEEKDREEKEFKGSAKVVRQQSSGG